MSWLRSLFRLPPLPDLPIQCALKGMLDSLATEPEIWERGSPLGTP